MFSQRDRPFPCCVHSAPPYFVCSICSFLVDDRIITPNTLMRSADKLKGSRYMLVFLDFKKFPLHSHCWDWYSRTERQRFTNTRPRALAVKQSCSPFNLSLPSFVFNQIWAYAVEFFSHFRRVSDGSKLIRGFVQEFRYAKHVPQVELWIWNPSPSNAKAEWESRKKYQNMWHIYNNVQRGK